VNEAQAEREEAAVGVPEVSLAALHEGLHDCPGGLRVARAHGDHAARHTGQANHLHRRARVAQDGRQQAQDGVTVRAGVRQTQTCKHKRLLNP